MAPAKKSQKKQAAQPAPAKKSVPAKKLTRKEKSVANKATHRINKVAARAAAKEFRASRIAEVKIAEPVQRVTTRTGAPGNATVEYTPELAAQLFERIVSGMSLESISQIENMPSLSTLLKWIGTPTHKFSEDYLKAKDLLVPLYEERVLDVTRNPLQGEIVTTRYSARDGETTETRRIDATERSKMYADALKWTLAHLRPKKHGRQSVVGELGPNEQLTALFNSIKAGPASTETEDDVQG